MALLDPAQHLALRVTAAVRNALDVELTDALIRPSAPGRGADYQCNVAMSLAKRLGMPSRDVAERIVEHLDAADIVEPPSIGGPGFINLTLSSEWLDRHLTALAADERVGIPLVAEPKRVVVDLSAPNVAKEMHVGHLRSTIIGSALVRLLRFAGHEVIPQNHLGDWGTPFGMLLEYTRELGLDERITGSDSSEHSIADLNEFYQQARRKFDADPDFAERARARVVAIQGGDPESLTLWRAFVAESARHFSQVYDLLDVDLTPEDIRGESFYNPVLPEIVEQLTERGIATISDGALCVFPPGFTGAEGEPLPMIIRKSDGGYNYSTTDLATLRFRVNELKANQLIYVVGHEQQLHFQMIFAVGRQAGWLPDDVTAEHVGFGMLLGDDGKRFRTRAGESVKLVDLVTEAIERAKVVVAERSDLPEEDQELVARQVGVGAVKYADLSSDRNRDYVFSWSRMLAMEGNTSVYLQYANARIQSVLRRAAEQGHPVTDAPVLVGEPAERALAMSVARFSPAVLSAADALEPHRLCGHLYEIATEFSRFYENCPILSVDDPAVRASRLRLAELTSRALVTGLMLLGISAPPRL